MWNRKTVELLLVQFGQKENLYNVRHPDYQDRVKRSKSLFEIYECLKDVDANVTLDSIQLKIHSLRTQYLKEIRKVADSKRSGVGLDDIHVPKLWCYDKMKFLKTFVQDRLLQTEVMKAKSFCDKTDIEIDDYDDCSIHGPYSSSISIEVETSESSTSQPSTPKQYEPDLCAPQVSTSAKKRKSILSEQINGVKKLICNRIEEKSEYEWLSKQLEFEIRSIHDEQIRREIAWKIQSVLREAVLADINKRNCTLPVHTL